MRSLGAAGLLFLLLGLALILASSVSAGSVGLLLLAGLLFFASRWRPRLCRLARIGSAVTVDGAPQPGAHAVQARWSGAHAAHLELMLLGDERPMLVVSHPHVGATLAVAERLTEELGLALCSDADTRVETADPPPGATATLRRSASQVRAQLASAWVGAVIAVYIGILTWTHVDLGRPLHPISIACAVLAPGTLLGIALLLKLLTRRICFDGPLRVVVQWSSLRVFSQHFSDAKLGFIALLHPQLRLAYLWLRDNEQSILLTTDSESLAHVAAALKRRGVTNLMKNEDS